MNDSIKLKKEFEINIYNEFSEEIKDIWTNFYKEVKGQYNLSYEWNNIWWKYFGNKKKLHIIVLKFRKEIKLIAPFFINKKSINLIGQGPDLFDEFNILFKEKSDLEKLFNYLDKIKLNLDFRYVNSETEIGKLLIKKLYQKGSKYYSFIVDTKPYLELVKFEASKKMRQDITRCKNNIKKYTKNELEFIFENDKEEKYIDEFINIHKTRWNGGPFNNIKNYDVFIKDIFLNYNLLKLSRLKIGNDTVAYHLGYMGENKILCSSIPAYNIEYSKFSPGKILLNELLNYTSLNTDICNFDFGRGAESYKYWFAEKSNILFNVKTFEGINNIFMKNSIIFIMKLLNKILYKYN